MTSHYQPLPAKSSHDKPMSSRCTDLTDHADPQCSSHLRGQTHSTHYSSSSKRMPQGIQPGKQRTGEIKQTFIMAFHEPVSVTGTVLLFLGCFPPISRETVDRLKSRRQNREVKVYLPRLSCLLQPYPVAPKLVRKAEPCPLHASP
jgi:hypothetical protein